MTAELPKISVIIPVYNRHDTIRRAINSIPEYSDLEVVISDDASSGSFDYLEKDYPKIKIVRSETNAGAGVARNRGMDIATGDWITFLDSDDMLLPNAFDIFHENIRQYNLISGSVEYWKNERREETYVNPIFLVHGTFFRNSFLKKNNLRFHPDLRNGEDIYFKILTCYFAKKQVLNLDYTNYRYLINDKSTTELRYKNQMDFVYEESRKLRLYLLCDITESDYDEYDKFFNEQNKEPINVQREIDFLQFNNLISPKRKLSIIIPLYNSHEWIKDTLDSLYEVMGNYKGQFEVICTDDASNDSDYSYLKKYPDLVLLNNTQRKYMGCNRNRGLRYAVGEFVLFLDSDDAICTAGINKFMSIDTKGINIIHMGMEIVENGESMLFGNVDYCIHSDIYRTNFLRQYDIRFSELLQTSEDTYFHRRAVNIIERNHLSDSVLKIENVPLVKWISRPDSTYNTSINGRCYDEEHLYTGVCGDILVCSFDNGIDFLFLKDILLHDLYTWMSNLINYYSKGDNFKKSNIKVLMAVSVLLYEYMNTSINIPEFEGNSIYQMIKNAPIKCSSKQKQRLLSIFKVCDLYHEFTT